jgi:hypothetical protein
MENPVLPFVNFPVCYIDICFCETASKVVVLFNYLYTIKQKKPSLSKWLLLEKSALRERLR